MAPDVSIGAPPQAELEAVYGSYLGFSPMLHPETGAGGKLLYAGELDLEGSRLVRAANIAGAASLSATADPARQRLAIREGTIDFLVTSLDEALRILKNEIRKRNPVAVGIGAPPSQVVAEMLARGVLPDVVRGACEAELADFISQGAQPIGVAPTGLSPRLIMLQFPPADFESRVLALIPGSDHAARRWVRLAPRYLGPAGRRVRSAPYDPALAAALGMPQE